jgi:hypothetical protein
MILSPNMHVLYETDNNNGEDPLVFITCGTLASSEAVLCASSRDAYRASSLKMATALCSLEPWQISPLKLLKPSQVSAECDTDTLFLSYIKTTGGLNYALFTKALLTEFDGVHGSEKRCTQMAEVRPIYASDNWAFAFLNTTGRIVPVASISCRTAKVIASSFLAMEIRRACPSCSLQFPSWISLRNHFRMAHRLYCTLCQCDCDAQHWEEKSFQELENKTDFSENYTHMFHAVASGMLNVDASPHFIWLSGSVTAKLTQMEIDSISPSRKKSRQDGSDSDSPKKSDKTNDNNEEHEDAKEMDISPEKKDSLERKGEGNGEQNDSSSPVKNDDDDVLRCWACTSSLLELTDGFVSLNNLALLTEHERHLEGPIRHVITHESSVVCLGCLKSTVSSTARCVCGINLRALNADGTLPPVDFIPIPEPRQSNTAHYCNCISGACINPTISMCRGWHPCHATNPQQCLGFTTRDSCLCDRNMCDSL